jgi:PAS domain S-box-containing protein
MIAKDGDIIPVLVSGSPIIEKGEVVAKVGVIKDFRREKALRDSIREEKDYTETIMESMAEDMVVVDRDYRIVKANMQARVSAGRDIRGELCHEAFHRTGEKCFFLGVDCPVRMVFETGRPFRTLHEHMEDGRAVFREIIAYPIKSPSGEVRLAVEILRDVTERKRFEDEIERKNRELTALNGISRVLSQSLKAEDIFNSVLDKVIGLVGMDGGGIYFLDEAGRDLRCEYHRGVSQEFVKTIARLRLGEDIPGRVALSGQPVLTSDISVDPIGEKSMLRHSGMKGYASFPIKGKEKLLGVFSIFSFRSHAFTPEEESTLGSISEMVGIALENIRLYERLRELFEQQRKRREEEKKNLLDLSTMLSATMDIRAATSSCLSFVRESCKADYALLLEYDGSGNLTLGSATGGDIAEGTVLYPEGVSSLESYAIEKKRPVTVRGIAADPRYYLPEQLRMYSTACAVPLYTGGKTLGAFTLYYRVTKEPREEDIGILQTTASMLSVAIERARLYEEAILEKGMAETILESIADGVMTVNVEGRVVSMNRAAGDIIGIQPPWAVGSLSCDVFRYSEDNTELRWKLGEFLLEATEGRRSTAEADLVSVDGRHVPLLLSSAPVRDRKGGIVGVVHAMRDMSREKEIDMLKTEFVKQVSHAFRTPLTALVGMTEMILEGDVPPERTGEYLDTILAEGRRLSGMVSDLLDVARIESGMEGLKLTDIDFAAFLGDIAEAVGQEVRDRAVRYSSRVEADVSGFKADEEKLKLLVRNLVENSLAYSDPGAAVDVSVGADDGNVLIMVRDEGWGIPEEDLRHVGEKFYRGRNVVGTKGTGLGLSLCRQIAKMHGGRLLIESETGRGTTVTVELPRRF